MSSEPTIPPDERGRPQRLGGGLLLGLWLALALADGVAALLLPAEWYAFREWELARSDQPAAPFRRSFRFESDRVSGDLANLARAPLWRVFKRQIFTTDVRGLRNPGWREDSRARVIVLGDSLMVGSQVSDEDVFALRLGRELNEPVYSFAGAEPLVALTHRYLKRLGAEVVVLGLGEATLRRLGDPGLAGEAAPLAREPEPLPDSRWGRFRRLDPARRFSDHLVGQARFSLGFRPPTVPYADEETGMLFSGDALRAQRRHPPPQAIEQLAHQLAQLARVLGRRGLRTVLVLIPDKENVYAERIPASLRGGANAFLPGLTRQLVAARVPTLDLTPIFRGAASSAGPELYFPDDTHWTPEAIRIAARHVAQSVRARPASTRAGSVGDEAR